MVGHFRLRAKDRAYAIGLPNDMTCWDFPKRSSILPEEALNLCFLIARQTENLEYVTAELEKGFEKKFRKRKKTPR